MKRLIAVSFALPSESSDLIGLLRKRRHVSSGNGKIFYGKIESQSIAVLHTGVGPDSCKPRIDDFLQAERPRCLISSGFAGAVREDIQVGALVLAENRSDSKLLSVALQILAENNVHTVKLLTSGTIADSIAARKEIARDHDADAIDMETKTIAQACSAHGIPMLSLRVISDSFHEPFPLAPGILFDVERQRTNPAKLLFYLIRHPAAIFGLVRFARQIRQARSILTDAIVDLVCQGNW